MKSDLRAKYLFFTKKLQKIAQRLGDLPLTPIACSSKTPICDTFELRKFTLYVSQFQHFHFLTISLGPLLSVKSWLSAKAGRGFSFSILRYVCPHKKFRFRKFLMTSLHVICCLPPPPPPPPPNQKSWLHLWIHSMSKSRWLRHKTVL